MANLRFRSGRYYAEFYDPDRYPPQKRITLRTQDEKVARGRLVDYERRFALGTFDPWESPVPKQASLLREAVRAYLRMREKSSISRATLRSDEGILNQLTASLPGTMLMRQVRAKDVDILFSNLRSKGRSAKTVATYHARLNTFFGWGVEKGYLQANPMQGMKKPKVSRRAPRYFTREQFASLLKRIDQDAMDKKEGRVDGKEKSRVSLRSDCIRWLKDVVVVAVETGMRRGEICNMRWNWVNFERSEITIRCDASFRTKSHHERVIPMGSGAEAVLRRLQGSVKPGRDDYVFKGMMEREGANAQLNADYLTRRFNAYVEKAELPKDLTFHALRHTFASWLVIDGVDLYRVKELLGHASVEMTQVYAHLAPSSLRAAISGTFGKREAL